LPRLDDTDDSEDDRDRKWLDRLLAPDGNSRRGICLASTAALDALLTELLETEARKRREARRKFIERQWNSLTFADKITAAQSLGLINELETNKCNTFRLVRNRFAHDAAVTFYDPYVIKKVSILRDRRLHGSSADAFFMFYSSICDLILTLKNGLRE